MKILAIDLTYGSIGGADTQIVQIIKNIDVFSFDQYVIYTNANNLELFKKFKNNNISIVSVAAASGSLLKRVLWQQLVLPFRLLSDGISVLYSPGNISPVFSFTKKAQWIGTIGPFEKDFYKYFPAKNRLLLYLNKLLMKYSALTSAHVFFESNYTLNLFVNKYRFNKYKGSVINIGRGDSFFSSNKYIEQKILPFVDKRVILTVSHLYPYKNIEVLLKSFSRYSQDDEESILLIAGSTPFDNYYNSLCSLTDSLGLSERVIFLGKMNQSELRELYNLCSLFIFTSPFENFAYTLVEAMSCGAPILTTNTTAMPETCGSAALYFDPFSVSDLLEKMTILMSNDLLRNQYKQLSIKQSLTIDDYREVNVKTNTVLSNISLNKG